MSQLNVLIMGQSYRLTCKAGEEPALQEAVAYLDAKMCGIRDAGRLKGTDRIAVIAALGVAAELLSTKSPAGPFSDMAMSEIGGRIASMHATLDDALAPQENLF